MAYDTIAHSVLPALSSYKIISIRMRGEKGQGLVEYALILVMIALVAVFSISAFGTTLYDMVNTAASNLPSP